MRNRKSVDVVAIAAVLTAGAVVFFSHWEIPQRPDRQIHTELARTLAREALDLLPPGGQVTVIARDIEAYHQPAMEITVKELEKTLARGGVEVRMIPIQLDPLRSVEVPPGDFFEAIRRAQTDHVIISLLGPPVLDSEQRQKLGQIKPKIVALCTGNLAEETDLRGLFQSGLLHAAIVNRRDIEKSDPHMADRKFQELYAVIEAGTVSKLAARTFGH